MVARTCIDNLMRSMPIYPGICRRNTWRIFIMKVKIQDLKDVAIKGVNVAFTESCDTYREDFFEWTAFPVVTRFKTDKIMSGLLQGWHHTPNFSVIEYHEDAEQFFFTEGTALMLFIDIVDGKPAMDTAQIVRIPAGTQLDIAAGKGHFVAVAEGCTFKAIVVSPVQDAPRMDLSETVCGE